MSLSGLGIGWRYDWSATHRGSERKRTPAFCGIEKQRHRRVCCIAFLKAMPATAPSEQLAETQRQQTDYYKWGVVAMLWFVCFFNYADRQAIFAVFPKLRTEFDLSMTQ